MAGYKDFPDTIEVNRQALGRILAGVNRGGFLSNELGVRYVPDERGVFTVLVADSEAPLPGGTP